MLLAEIVTLLGCTDLLALDGPAAGRSAAASPPTS